MSQSKGDSRERELVNMLHEAGFGATRVPKSGGGTKRPLPDILAGDGQQSYAIEAKSREGDLVYITGDQTEELVQFARRFGARARIGVRFDYEEWYFFHPGDLHVTDGGNYRIKKQTALSYGMTFRDLVNIPPGDQVGITC